MRRSLAPWIIAPTRSIGKRLAAFGAWKDRLQPRRRIPKHRGQDVLVAHGHADLAVAEELHGRADGGAGGEEVGGGAVTQVVDAVGGRQVGAAQDLFEVMTHVVA